MRQRDRAFALLAVCLFVVASGCRGMPNNISSKMSTPWSHRTPGNIQEQRFNAVAHDIYYDNDAGPEVVGGRPREYSKQLPEAVRSRWLSDNHYIGGH